MFEELIYENKMRRERENIAEKRSSQFNQSGVLNEENVSNKIAHKIRIHACGFVVVHLRNEICSSFPLSLNRSTLPPETAKKRMKWVLERDPIV